MKLGYLGPKGSYSYEAAKTYIRYADLVPITSFYRIIQAVEKGDIDEGILPVENFIEGPVAFIMDRLLKTEETKIVGELMLPIRYNLVGLDSNLDNSIEKIDYVYSHPQVFEQCREYFKTHIPRVSLISCESTSLACAKAQKKGGNFAAIANMEAALIYNLNILETSIQNNSLHQTRFIIIGKKPTLECYHCKISIAFSFLNDKPGTLYKVLKEFADRDINLTRIESRPTETQVGKYIFYVDFIGTPEDDTVKEALYKIKNIAAFFKTLGIYSAF